MFILREMLSSEVQDIYNYKFLAIKGEVMVITLVVLDIDGVLTDGKLTLDAQNNEYKSINFRDLDAITVLKNNGIKLALLTGEDTALVEAISKRLGITHIIKGEKDKRNGLTTLSDSLQIPLSNICYIGDSDRDTAALKICGLGFVPQNATKKARESASVILKTNGGDGVVHEALEYLITHDHLSKRE
jgi:YrbI family 3-deoxy-D-manno-octulosonate 8-phosphate phosphatase